MTYHGIKVAIIKSDTFAWTEDNWNENVETLFEFPPIGSSGFFAVMNGVTSGKYEGRQLDWGAWLAIVSKEQVTELIRDAQPMTSSQGAAFMKNVESLDAGTKYGIVAWEL